ncbi:OmpH family outer membrane protein [Flaviaesturariibacter aridisoli]|uniref:OmpH family outer membrane protein n=1 Tax=Flaviaesturariibacter aridisoli TaxID=2545761 RepID=A0A4R4E8Y7_9BACT|nr:OmpH family outer membrane protein [Flaviaesturariibacter aridisoli]TCZ74561.1 OmpH family outer membrane protein [Flaviaesturariibacter aridisoli]
MKNGLLALNIVLLVAVGVLFYLHFSGSPKPMAAAPAVKSNGTHDPGHCRIAYFEMDSIEGAYALVKDVKTVLDRKEGEINSELARMERDYRSKAAEYQAQAVNMNQTQSEMAQRDMMQRQQTLQAREAQLRQEYQVLQANKQQEVRKKIEEYLKGYNANGTYTYIMSYEPGLFFFKDSAYNITGDLIKGLNADYKPAAKK